MVSSDGVSVFTALKEGLKDKTQTSFEKTYAIDKMYKEGGPMISLGRFWAVLPWPMRDREKSLQYYREYQLANAGPRKIFAVLSGISSNSMVCDQYRGATLFSRGAHTDGR
jgi:hypothetical protein